MSSRMFRSGGSGYSTGIFYHAPSKEELEKERKQGIRNETKRWRKEWQDFVNCLGYSPGRDDTLSLVFNIEYRKGRKGKQIAEFILSNKKLDRGKGIQARLKEWYAQDDYMKK